jgi:hypothetical protein
MNGHPFHAPGILILAKIVGSTKPHAHQHDDLTPWQWTTVASANP